MKENFDVVFVEIDKLIEPDYNPRKISAKQREDIVNSLERFGFVQPLVVNSNCDRENIVIGGSQRMKIARQIGFKEVPVVFVDLNEEQEKELNLRLNKNQAEFDFGMLKDFFDKELLFSVGFSEKEIGKIETDFDKKFDRFNDENCTYPLIPKYDEKYEAYIIICETETESVFVQTKLGIEGKSKSYKSSFLGKTNVITAKQL